MKEVQLVVNIFPAILESNDRPLSLFMIAQSSSSADAAMPDTAAADGTKWAVDAMVKAGRGLTSPNVDWTTTTADDDVFAFLRWTIHFYCWL